MPNLDCRVCLTVTHDERQNGSTPSIYTTNKFYIFRIIEYKRKQDTITSIVLGPANNRVRMNTMHTTVRKKYP